MFRVDCSGWMVSSSETILPPTNRISSGNSLKTGFWEISASNLPQTDFAGGFRSAMSLCGAFNRFVDRAANGVCNDELSEIEAVLGSLRLCEVPVADRSRCGEGESVRAEAIHHVAGAIQSATEVALRTGKEVAIAVPTLVGPSFGGAWCKRDKRMKLSEAPAPRERVPRLFAKVPVPWPSPVERTIYDNLNQCANRVFNATEPVDRAKSDGPPHEWPTISLVGIIGSNLQLSLPDQRRRKRWK